jgi:HTH-type transcriptional regulator / antitoxin HipB
MQVKTINDIGSLIRDRRAHLRWSQEELATRVGVSRLWLVQLEKGKPTAQIGLVLRTLKELGLALDASAPSATGQRSTNAGAVDLDRIIQGARPTRS